MRPSQRNTGTSLSSQLGPIEVSERPRKPREIPLSTGNLQYLKAAPVKAAERQWGKERLPKSTWVTTQEERRETTGESPVHRLQSLPKGKFWFYLKIFEPSGYLHQNKYIKTHTQRTYSTMVLPRWHRGKESTCQWQGMQETLVSSPGQEDPLEKEMATCFSILAWKIPWTEEPGRLQSMGSPRVRYDWVHIHNWIISEIHLFFDPNSQREEELKV